MVQSGEAPKIEVEQVQGGDEEPLKLQLDAFLHSVATGTPPAVSGEDGAAALTLAHQVLDSIGGFVRRDSDPRILARVPVPQFQSLLNLELHLRGCLDWFYALKRRAGWTAHARPICVFAAEKPPDALAVAGKKP